MLDHCKHVTIPFVGGAAILPFLKARGIVANDKHDLAINFYQYLSGINGSSGRQKLIARCQATLAHPSEWMSAKELLGIEWRGTWRQAWALWAWCWIGRKGRGGLQLNGGSMSTRWTASGGSNASRLQSVIKDLPLWAEQLARCEWKSLCFRELLPMVKDNEKCGIYCDPPWVGVGKCFVHPFTEEDHVDLADLLRPFLHTTIVLRYGDDPLIRELYRDWEIIEASSRTRMNKLTPEIWLRNRRPS